MNFFVDFSFFQIQFYKTSNHSDTLVLLALVASGIASSSSSADDGGVLGPTIAGGGLVENTLNDSNKSQFGTHLSDFVKSIGSSAEDLQSVSQNCSQKL